MDAPQINHITLRGIYTLHLEEARALRLDQSMQHMLARLVVGGEKSPAADAKSDGGSVPAAAAEQLTRSTVARLCNEAVEGISSSVDHALLVAAAARKLEELFDILRIDHANDHNTRDTPGRVAKMLVHETLRGRYSPPPEITEFENARGFDDLIVTGPIELRSTCAHHMMPIYGEVFIGILPATDGKIIGLSKYDRIVDFFAARLQIQEELVKQIGNFIVEKTEPRGLAVRVSAVHMCKTHRGVRASHASRMVNTTYYGVLAGDRALQNTFLQECLSLGKGA
jgi:GTP cyclohydrolase I